jgi:SAM-dependent methyltransferase
MEWFVDLYDQFRMRTGFGQVSDDETREDVDFICDVLGLDDGAKVLDLFCGTGRHSLELAKRGYSVTGIELNHDYLELGKKGGKAIENTPNFIQGDVRCVNYGEGYDAVIIMYQSFGYFSDSEDKLVLSKVYDVLNIGGKFLIEILNRNWILNNFVEIQETEVEGILIVEKRKFDELTNRNNFIIQRHEKDGIITKQGSWRLYTANEMIKILGSLGFQYLGGYSNREKEILDDETRLMRLLFKK